MGEAAEMMLDGTLCSQCGQYLEGAGMGYPMKCPSCRREGDDLSASWHDYREDQKQRRAKRVAERTEQLLALRDEGMEVVQLTPYHIRINRHLDIYPTHGKWLNLKTGKRGQTRDLAKFAKEFFKPTTKK